MNEKLWCRTMRRCDVSNAIIWWSQQLPWICWNPVGCGSLCDFNYNGWRLWRCGCNYCTACGHQSKNWPWCMGSLCSWEWCPRWWSSSLHEYIGTYFTTCMSTRRFERVALKSDPNTRNFTIYTSRGPYMYVKTDMKILGWAGSGRIFLYFSQLHKTAWSLPFRGAMNGTKHKNSWHSDE